MSIQLNDKKTKQPASRSSHTDAAVSRPQSAASTVHSRAEKKETLAQKKLRQARELVDAAKQQEQKAWRAKWEAQKTDPVYQARQARLAENREERSRKTAIGRENRRLARTEAIVKLANLSEEENIHTAWHESAHAVIEEMLSHGVIYATIIPTANGEVEKAKTGVLEIDSLGHVIRERDALPISARRRCLHIVAGLLAGGLATEKALGDAGGAEGDEDQIKDITLHTMHLSRDEAIAFIDEATVLCKGLMEEPKVWKAIEEVKEALLNEKTINGHLVRAIVKKQERPELFPIDISKQRSFHFRQNYLATDSQNGAALYVLRMGANLCSDGGLATPPYIDRVIKDNAQPSLNFRPEPIQLRLLLSPEEQANTRLINRAISHEFAFRQNMANADKLLLTGAVGREIEIPGNNYVPRMSVVIESHEGNVMTFVWQGMSLIITQDGFEFDFYSRKSNSIGILLAFAINKCARRLDEEASEQDECPLKEAA
jgi:hypothetical protein